MRLKSLILLIFFFVTTSAFSQVGPGRVQVLVLPGKVAVEIYNPNYDPIVCTGQVFGLTASGAVFTAYFVEQVLPAGDFRNAFVLANLRNPFVRGWHAINCRFLGL